MVPIGKEATDFVRACDAVHALLAIETLAPNDQELIEFSCNALRLKLAGLALNE